MEQQSEATPKRALNACLVTLISHPKGFLRTYFAKPATKQSARDSWAPLA